LAEQWLNCTAGKDYHGGIKELEGAMGSGITKTGMPRSKGEHAKLGDKPMSDAEKKERGAIDIDKIQKAGLMPDAWINGITNMKKWCALDENGNEMKSAEVGWNHGKRSMQCLNFNPNHSLNCTSKIKTKFTCRCGQTCERGKNTHDTAKYQDILDSNCDVADKVTDSLGNLAGDAKKTVSNGISILGTKILSFAP
jgi:hypothetical protein